MSYIATYLIYIAVIARAIGWNHETAPISTTIWILLAIFGVILFSQEPITHQFPFYPRLYTLIQSTLVIAMLLCAPSLDFISMLLLPLCFQAVQFFRAPVGFIWIAGLLLAMSGILLFGLERQAALTTIISGSGAGILMGSFAHLINRTEHRRQENQHLFGELQQAYHQLKDASTKAEELAAATERHRLVRELHDSLTQTLFGMNLAVQAAQLSMAEAQSEADEHLRHLQSLSRSAVSEVLELTGQATLHPTAEGDLAQALQKLADERRERDGLQVSLEVSGQRALIQAVEANLYRITQEALNNISRHSGVSKAVVRLDLDSPIASLEIVDDGCGFVIEGGIQQLKGFGLTGMNERAREIGWALTIQSGPGRGTRIRVEERPA
jgi:signal transduction histidine kinase